MTCQVALLQGWMSLKSILGMTMLPPTVPPPDPPVVIIWTPTYSRSWFEKPVVLQHLWLSVRRIPFWWYETWRTVLYWQSLKIVMSWAPQDFTLHWQQWDQTRRMETHHLLVLVMASYFSARTNYILIFSFSSLCFSRAFSCFWHHVLWYGKPNRQQTFVVQDVVMWWRCFTWPNVHLPQWHSYWTFLMTLMIYLPPSLLPARLRVRTGRSSGSNMLPLWGISDLWLWNPQMMEWLQLVQYLCGFLVAEKLQSVSLLHPLSFS
jgi:hypothetical protein